MRRPSLLDPPERCQPAVRTRYPNLEERWVRGARSSRSQPLEHGVLRKLVIQSAARASSAAVDRSTLPGLVHLELYLGTDDYVRRTPPTAEILAADSDDYLAAHAAARDASCAPTRRLTQLASSTCSLAR